MTGTLEPRRPAARSVRLFSATPASLFIYSGQGDQITVDAVVVVLNFIVNYVVVLVVVIAIAIVIVNVTTDACRGRLKRENWLQRGTSNLLR